MRVILLFDAAHAGAASSSQGPPRRDLGASTWQVRLVIGVPLQISGKLYEITG